jgi:hypothetical protein
LRGGTQYVPGDLTRGSSKGVKEYAGKNKAKLASTGGASVGSMIGLGKDFILNIFIRQERI